MKSYNNLFISILVIKFSIKYVEPISNVKPLNNPDPVTYLKKNEFFKDIVLNSTQEILGAPKNTTTDNDFTPQNSTSSIFFPWFKGQIIFPPSSDSEEDSKNDSSEEIDFDFADIYKSKSELSNKRIQPMDKNENIDDRTLVLDEAFPKSTFEVDLPEHNYFTIENLENNPKSLIIDQHQHHSKEEKSIIDGISCSVLKKWVENIIEKTLRTEGLNFNFDENKPDGNENFISHTTTTTTTTASSSAALLESSESEKEKLLEIMEIIDEDIKDSTSGKDYEENDPKYEDPFEISFRSLFHIPKTKKEKNSSFDCPEGKKKDHKGKCRTPFTRKPQVIRIK